MDFLFILARADPSVKGKNSRPESNKRKSGLAFRACFTASVKGVSCPEAPHANAKIYFPILKISTNCL